MKNKITYKDIAESINKSEANIKYIKKTNPQLLEILRIGVFCKKNNLKFEDLKNLRIEKLHET